MARYIDADKMIDGFKINMERMDINNLTKEIANIFIEGLQMEPTADVVEVKHGEWIPIMIQDNYLEPPYCDTIKCSECGQEADVSFHDAKYCFECGAKMDGGSAE